MSIGRPHRWVALLVSSAAAGCSDPNGGEKPDSAVVELPDCDEEQFASSLDVEYTDGEYPITGLTEVTLSEPDTLRLTSDGRFVELEFPEMSDIVLPEIGSEVNLFTRVEGAFYAAITDPETDELWFEHGEASISYDGPGRMRFKYLDEEPVCRGTGPYHNLLVSPGAVAFETDEGTIVLGHQEEATSSIDGNPVRLRVFEAFHFRGGGGGDSVAGQALIARLDR